MLRYVIFLAALVGCAHEPRMSDAPHVKADAYARLSFLHGLRASDTNELRIWAERAWAERQVLVIIRPGEAIAYERWLAPSGPKRFVIHHRQKFDTSNILAKLENVADFHDADVTEVSCPATDGVSYIIDSAWHGKRVAFNSVNPSMCDEPNAKLVMSLIDSAFAGAQTKL